MLAGASVAKLRRRRLHFAAQRIAVTAADATVDSSAESDSNPFSQRITARVSGRFTQEEIADLYRASDAYVSKAGGAAELIASSTSFVRGFGHDAEQLKRIVLGMLGQPAGPAKVAKVARTDRPNTTMPPRAVAREGIVLR